MTEAPTSLLSERARRLYDGPAEPGGFWKRLASAVGLDKPRIQLAPKTNAVTPAELKDAGFEPFVTVAGHTVHVSVNDDDILVHLLKEETPVDLDGYTRHMGIEETEIAVLGYLYWVAINDDLRIDDSEQAALLALGRLFKTGATSVDELKRQLMLGYVYEATEDGRIVPLEKQILGRISRALELDPEDARVQYTIAIAKYAAELKDKDDLGPGDIEAVREMAQELKVPEHETESVLAPVIALLEWMQLRRGHLPVLDDPGIALKPGESAHFQSRTVVHQQKTIKKTYRGYAGTRIKIGSMPFYFGGSAPRTVSREEIVRIGEGSFTLTNQRIILLGTKITYTIRLERVLGVEALSDAIQIMNEGRYGGRYYEVDEPWNAGEILRQLIGM